MGRVGFIVDARPIVLPVNYVAEADAVFFCTGAGTKLSALAAGSAVAFEVDDSRPLYHTGWSVLVSGRSEVVEDAGERARVEALELDAWAPGTKDEVVRVRAELISGREITRP